MNQRLENIRTISNRLVIALVTMIALCIVGGVIVVSDLKQVPVTIAGLGLGFIGGFVGLQQRLRKLPPDDLTLLANSWVCVLLSPIVGGILAIVIYVLFASGLVAGEMFPKMVPDTFSGSESAPTGLSLMFAIHCPDAANYTKLLFWFFVAGFSERFATNLIGRFETRASTDDAAEKPTEK